MNYTSDNNMGNRRCVICNKRAEDQGIATREWRVEHSLCKTCVRSYRLARFPIHPHALMKWAAKRGRRIEKGGK